MPLGFRKIGIGVAATGWVLLTGCMDTMGPAPERAPIHASVQKSSALTSDSSSASMSLGRAGTAILNATFKSISK